jgi:hypothetical protein
VKDYSFLQISVCHILGHLFVEGYINRLTMAVLSVVAVLKCSQGDLASKTLNRK